MTENLSTLRSLLAAQHGQLPQADQATFCLDLAAEQDLNRPEGRATAGTAIKKVAQLCGGAQEIVALATSVAALIAAWPT
ncbi:hypothetical protein GXW82_32930 [Streptacidiphilus sp. 4-A2]|nr:hypothetical protein [Streptacidiphilus sp. 4-A2]